MYNFNDIYNDYSNMVLTYTSMRMPTHAAEELTQDIFMKVYDNLDRYDDSKGKISTWIMTITRHAVIDKMRKVKLETTSLDGMVDEDGKDTFQVSIAGTPLTEVIGAEYRDTIKTVILELPKTYRRMANLFYNCEMSYDEIADRMKVSKGTVKGKLSRARKIMQEEINFHMS